MKIAFRNLDPTPKVKSILERLNFSISVESEADVLCTKLNTMALPHPINHAVSVFFVSETLIHSSQFQRLLAETSQPAFVFSSENWEDVLACALPTVGAFLNLKRLTQKQHNQIQHLSNHTDQLVNQFNSDLELATKIHHQLLPSSDLHFPGITVTSKYLPASGLGGDYFDVFELQDKRNLGVLIADSQTHGMASALLSTLLKLRLDELKASGSLPQNLMNHLNQELFSIHQSKLPGLDLVFGVIDRSTLTFEYSSAGSLRPLCWKYPSFSEVPCTENPPLGSEANHQFKTSSIQLRPGDLLFFHTNGLEAVFGKSGKAFRDDLASVFKSIKQMAPLDFQTELLAKISQYRELQSDIPDDITLIQLFIDKKTLYLAQSK
ncbi:MAG: PP2C family protein-serine/threonine phosphatase [Pseudomonadota bacterium]